MMAIGETQLAATHHLARSTQWPYFRNPIDFTENTLLNCPIVCSSFIWEIYSGPVSFFSVKISKTI
jgi:hypothetical protein